MRNFANPSNRPPTTVTLDALGGYAPFQYLLPRLLYFVTVSPTSALTRRPAAEEAIARIVDVAATVCERMIAKSDGASKSMMESAAHYLDAPGPNSERQAKLFALLYSAVEVQDRVARIYEATLAQSPQIRDGNFTLIGTDDLERLFTWYDREFFRGRLGEMIVEDDAHPMAFRLSSRLVSAAGQTVRQVRRLQRNGSTAVKVDYEISISTTLLYNTFQDVERPVTVGGLVCRDRLESLQRIFEHELLHLAEFLGWGRSNCRADNFHALSRRIFAHEGAYHDLITPRETARAAFDIHVGDQVSFEVDGKRQVGRVNRITRRATVLVESPRGQPFTDGKRYVPFYVPLPLLRKESPAR
jgi:hypothetical protein